MDLNKAIVTAIANQAEAVALATVDGVPQSMFAALATTDPAGMAGPTHCFANGWMLDTVIALFEADPAKYQVLPAAGRGRPASVMLGECTPTLYYYVGP